MDTFLTADWRRLIMANYGVPPALLTPHLPPGTELDIDGGECYVSLVAFLFGNARVKGLAIPFHTMFEEANLRFYVRRKDAEGWRRGVVFIREIVPRIAVALAANTLYRESYASLPMRHRWDESPERLQVSYGWELEAWHTLAVEAENRPTPIAAGSHEEFISIRHWGYTRWDEQTTNQYEVRHPRWEIYPIIDRTIEVDFGLVYGRKWSDLTGATPTSVILAEGSEVAVFEGERIR